MRLYHVNHCNYTPFLPAEQWLCDKSCCRYAFLTNAFTIFALPAIYAKGKDNSVTDFPITQEKECHFANLLFFLAPKQDVLYIYEDFTLRQTLEKWANQRFATIPVLKRSEAV